MTSFKESGCEFILKENTKFISLDNTEIYSKASQFLSCVEGVLLLGDKVYFIEVKRYDYFVNTDRENIDSKIKKLINKLVDSYFFVMFVKDNKIYGEIKNFLTKQDNLVFVIYICPLFNQSLEKDRKIIATETIKRKLLKKLSIFTDIILLIDTKKNILKLFKEIKKV